MKHDTKCGALDKKPEMTAVSRAQAGKEAVPRAAIDPNGGENKLWIDLAGGLQMLKQKGDER